MKISVIIPAYNCEATIQQTLDSIFSQTVQPYEILILNDGSIDRTLEIANSYRPRVKVFSQSNTGAGGARDALCRQAQGDLIAFLDPDDVWHPRYLETQCKLVDQYPDAVAYFTDHEQFTGLGGHAWNGDPTESEQGVAVMTSVQFLIRYLRSYSPFIPSNLCVPRSALLSLGDEPFKLRNSEDVYFFHLLAPRGRIVYLPQKLAGYRIREESYSSSRIRTAKAEVHVFELLADQYSALEDSGLRNTYWRCFATKRRMYAKHLLGIGDLALARDQIHKSLLISGPASKAKSLRLLLLSYLPAALQPEWPPEYRGWAGPRES